MGNVRVFQLARDLNLSSQEVIDRLKKLGAVDAKTASSSIDEDTADKLKRALKIVLAVGTVIAVALTSQPQRSGFPLTLELQVTRLPKRSWVKISQIRTLSTERIGKKIGSVDTEELAHIVDGLNEIIGA